MTHHPRLRQLFREREVPVRLAPPSGGTEPASVVGPLWLCIHLPFLSVEAVGFADESCLAVTVEQARRQLVLSATAAATARGIVPGMPVNAALALVPSLVLALRDERRERVLLRQIADRALRFTPLVSLEPPAAVLLEVRGSLRLFGGFEPLRAALLALLDAAGHRGQIAAAPTPQASLWLARAGREALLESRTELASGLKDLELDVLGWPFQVLRALGQMGVTTLGECLRLPRDGFARRFGAASLQQLDQALGRAPAPRVRHRAAATFSDALELPVDTDDAALLRQGFEQLLSRLAVELSSRQLAVAVLRCRLQHPNVAPTSWTLRPAEPVDTRVLSGLLALRLEAEPLPARVTALELRARLVPAGRAPDRDLLGGMPHPDDDLRLLLERLRARLGGGAVQGLGLNAEHRPEQAWVKVTDPLAQKSVPATEQPARPLWLLHSPLRLRARAEQPLWRGVLQLERGPERIETGWWDGFDVRRDYYQARNPAGCLLWIFRDLRKPAWYLHGIFG
jgi:protein ImuB